MPGSNLHFFAATTAAASLRRRFDDIPRACDELTLEFSKAAAARRNFHSASCCARVFLPAPVFFAPVLIFRPGFSEESLPASTASRGERGGAEKRAWRGEHDALGDCASIGSDYRSSFFFCRSEISRD